MRVKALGASGSEVPGHARPAFLLDGGLLRDAGTVEAGLHGREERPITRVLLSRAHLDRVKGLLFLPDVALLRDGEILGV